MQARQEKADEQARQLLTWHEMHWSPTALTVRAPAHWVQKLSCEHCRQSGMLQMTHRPRALRV